MIRISKGDIIKVINKEKSKFFLILSKQIQFGGNLVIPLDIYFSHKHNNYNENLNHKSIYKYNNLIKLEENQINQLVENISKKNLFQSSDLPIYLIDFYRANKENRVQKVVSLYSKIKSSLPVRVKSKIIFDTLDFEIFNEETFLLGSKNYSVENLDFKRLNSDQIITKMEEENFSIIPILSNYPLDPQKEYVNPPQANFEKILSIHQEYALKKEFLYAIFSDITQKDSNLALSLPSYISKIEELNEEEKKCLEISILSITFQADEFF
ncbi:MAG: hypothetical protein ACMXYB_00625 [Candidatus Woesearchaeota archaeon]